METKPIETYHNCPACYSFISDEFEHCPHCGAKQETPTEGESTPSIASQSGKSPLLIIAVVVVVLLLLLGVGTYFFVQYKQEEPIVRETADSVEAVVDSSLLYNDEYRQIERSEKYTIDLTHWWEVTPHEEAGDSMGDYDQVEERPQQCEFRKSLDLEWPLRLKGVKYIEQLQSAILSHFSEKRSVTIDDFVKTYFKQPGLDDIAGPFSLYDEVKLERCDAPDYCVQFRIVHEGHNGIGLGSGSYALLYYVAYDKMGQKLLTLSNVFSSGSSAGVIAQINREIARINKKEEERYANVTTIPESFQIGRTGITFVSTESPQYGYQGNYLEVTVPYNVLMPYLSDDFITMLDGQ